MINLLNPSLFVCMSRFRYAWMLLQIAIPANTTPDLGFVSKKYKLYIFPFFCYWTNMTFSHRQPFALKADSVFFWLWFSLGFDGRFQLRLDGDRWICAIGDIARTKAVNAPCEDDGSQVDMFSWTAQSTIKWPTSP